MVVRGSIFWNELINFGKPIAAVSRLHPPRLRRRDVICNCTLNRKNVTSNSSYLIFISKRAPRKLGLRSSRVYHAHWSFGQAHRRGGQTIAAAAATWGEAGEEDLDDTEAIR